MSARISDKALAEASSRGLDVTEAVDEVRRRNRSLRAGARNSRASTHIDSDDNRPPQEQREKFEYADEDTYEDDPSTPGGQKKMGAAKRNVTGSPLDLHYRRQRLSRRQFEAGDRFREDWYRSGLEAPVTAAYEGFRVDGSGPAWLTPKTHAAARARQEVRAALAHVGTRLAVVVGRFLVLEHTGEQIGRNMRAQGTVAAKASGLAIVRLGLDMLADHYRMPEG